MAKLFILGKPTFPLSEGQVQLLRDARWKHHDIQVIVPLSQKKEGGQDSDVTGALIARQITSMFSRKILICGISGSGKTYLSNLLAPAIGAVHLNNDVIRKGPHHHIGWTENDRIEHARLIGLWADMLITQGHDVIIDMICPTPATRKALNPHYVIWMNTETTSQYADTDDMFQGPKHPDYIVTSKHAEVWTRTLKDKLGKRVTVYVFNEITDIDLVAP